MAARLEPPIAPGANGSQSNAPGRLADSPGRGYEGREAGKEAGKEAGSQAGRESAREAGRQDPPSSLLPFLHITLA